MTLTKTLPIAMALWASLVVTACGRTDLGRSPTQVMVDRLEGASGAEPDKFRGLLYSDVITMVKKTVDGKEQDVPTLYPDLGKVTLRAMLRDQGTVAQTSPTGMNSVTFTRYHVQFIRSDGRNTQGVDVPYAFDSGFTVTVPAGQTTEMSFELVRHVAKQEAPLAGLAVQARPPIGQPQQITLQPIISTIAQVTFYGKDVAGNEVVATGNVGVNFGDFADPE